MGSGIRQFKEAIVARRFNPAYLLVGDEPLLIDNLLRDFINAAVDPAMRLFDVEVLSAATSSLARVIMALQSAPVTEGRVVIVRDAESLKAKGVEAIRRYLEQPAGGTTLVVVAPATAGPQLREGLGDNITTVNVESLSPTQTVRWIERYASHELHSGIGPEAAAALQRRVGPRLGELASELAKLAAYAGSETIDEAMVEAVTGIQEQEGVGALLDAVADQDARAAGSLLAGVMSTSRMSGVAVVMALSAQTIGIATAQALLSEGVRIPQIAATLKEMLRESRGIFTGRSWTDASASWTKAAGRWERAQIDRALRALDVAEVALKDSRVSTDEAIVEGLILSLCSHA